MYQELSSHLDVHQCHREISAKQLIHKEIRLGWSQDYSVKKKILEKEKRMQQAVLDIKKKYGKNAILKGMNLEEGATAKDRNSQNEEYMPYDWNFSVLCPIHKKGNKIWNNPL